MARFPHAILVISVLAGLLPAQEKKAPADPLPVNGLARLGTQRWRHGTPVTALASTPDGKLLVSGGQDGLVRVWEVPEGRERDSIDSFKRPVQALAISPDGKLLAAAGDRSEVRLRELKKGRLLHSFSLGKGEIAGLAFSPDGKLLIAGGNEGVVRVLDVGSGTPVRSIKVEGPIQQLAYMQDGKHFCAGDDGGLTIWPVAGGQVVRRLGGWLHSFSLTASKSVLVGEYDQPLRLHDLASGRLLFTLKNQDKEESLLVRPLVAASPAGGLLASGCGEGFVRVYNAETGAQVWHHLAHPAGVKALAFSGDGKILASADREGLIRLWNAARGKPLNTSEGSAAAVLGIALSPDSRSVATVGRDGVLRVYDAKSGTERRKESFELSQVACIAWSPDGKTLASSAGDREGVVALRDPETLRPRKVLREHRGAVVGLVFSADGKSLLSAGHDRTVREWDVGSGEERSVVTRVGNERLHSFSISPDRRFIVTADGTAWPHLQERDSTKEPIDLTGHSGGCLAVAVAPTGRVAVSGGRDNMLRLCELASGKERRALPGGSWTHSIAWAADGSLFASGHADGRVVVWDGRSGLRLRELKGHRGAVLSLAFSRDGKLLVSGSGDTTGLVWDVSVPRTRPERIELSEAKVKGLWEDLVSSDGSLGGEAIQLLARAPEQAVALIRGKMKPVREEDVSKLIKDLDSPRYAVRQKAIRQLMSVGRSIERRLRDELGTKPSLEVRRRLEDILSAIGNEVPNPEEVRTLRGIELLEMIGTRAAKELLKELAGGAEGYDLTREARMTLERMEQKR